MNFDFSPQTNQAIGMAVLIVVFLVGFILAVKESRKAKKLSHLKTSEPC